MLVDFVVRTAMVDQQKLTLYIDGVDRVMRERLVAGVAAASARLGRALMVLPVSGWESEAERGDALAGCDYGMFLLGAEQARSPQAAERIAALERELLALRAQGTPCGVAIAGPLWQAVTRSATGQSYPPVPPHDPHLIHLARQILGVGFPVRLVPNEWVSYIDCEEVLERWIESFVCEVEAASLEVQGPYMVRGATAQWSIRIRNRGALRWESTLLTVDTRGDLVVEPSKVSLPSLAPRDAYTAVLNVRALRPGRHQIEVHLQMRNGRMLTPSTPGGHPLRLWLNA